MEKPVFNLTEGARRDTDVYNLTEGARGEVTADLTQYNRWSDENKNNQMEAFKFFTHCTSHNFQNLKQLKPMKAESSWKAPLSEGNAPGGVWFAMGLYQGELPTISPYGEHRLLMPWKKLIDSLTVNKCLPLLYLESIQFRDDQRKRNVRLMLVKNDDTEKIKWCVKHRLPCLDLFNNPFMSLTQARDRMMTHKNVTEVTDKATWVVLLVPYAVDIDGCEFKLNAVDKFMR